MMKVDKATGDTGPCKSSAVHRKKTEKLAEKPKKDTDVAQTRITRENIADYTEIVKNMPDVRPEEIKRVKKKIKKNAYDDPEISKKTAEKILEEEF